MNLAEIFALHARGRPSHPALVDGDRKIAYGELERRIRGFAARLGERGIARGSIVGLALRDTADHVILHYALARLGAVIVPIDCRWTPAEQKRVADFFGASTVLVDAPSSLQGVRVELVDATWAEGGDDVPLAPGPDLPLLISLSSGTTGRPRGPRITHEQMRARFVNQWVTLTFNAQDRFLSVTPLYFGGGRTFAMSYLYAGGTVVMFPPPFDPQALVAEVRRRRITSLFLVPTQLRRLLDIAPARSAAPLLPSLRVLLSSGAPLSAAERQAIRERLSPNFFEYYASTEGGGTTVLTPDDQIARPDSVGRPGFMIDLEIVDDDGKRVEPGVTGLIRYRGPGVAADFYNDPEASREAFRDGWYYPGDLGAVDAEGYLFLRGRRKDMIIRGGINIYPVEIEQILSGHAAVADVAVIAWPSRDRGEEVAAFVVRRAAVEEAELREFCRARLAPYKIPKSVFFVDELPRNSAGKVLKLELAQRLPPA